MVVLAVAMEVVDRFPYLGDIVSRDGDDAAAVDARVESGGKVFGALRACVFASPSTSNKAKKAVYDAIVLSTVLYGCETWSLTEELYRRLRCMHAHHLRAMCRVSRSQAWEPHISTQELGQRLGLDSIEFYIARRQLRWLGHVSRKKAEELTLSCSRGGDGAARPRLRLSLVPSCECLAVGRQGSGPGHLFVQRVGERLGLLRPRDIDHSRSAAATAAPALRSDEDE